MGVSAPVDGARAAFATPSYGGPDEVVFVRDVVSGHITWSPAMEAVFGYAPADVASTLAWFAERVHPDDAERVLRAVRVSDEGQLVAVEYRFRRADGTYASVFAQAYALKDASGAPAIAIGSIRDVSRAGPGMADDLERIAAVTPDAVVGVDANGLIRMANAEAVALFGHPRDELIGMPVDHLVPDAARARHGARRAAYAAHPFARPMGSGIDLMARRRDGGLIPVDIALRTVGTVDGLLTIAAVRDLSARRRRDEQLRRQMEYVQLLRSVAASANEARSPEAALQAAVDQVCAVMRWPVGHVLVPAADGARLVSSNIWHLDEPARYAEFVEATGRVMFSAGVGLPGRVLAMRHPVVIPDFAAVSVPRGAAAVHAGLRSALGCPIALEDELVAVLEFFSPDELVADAELLDVMADVGTQVGRVIERERAQRTTLHLALHDPLTDLPNRHLLDDRLDQAIAHARRHDGRVALLFIDLDDFKSINDTFGHPAGDVVLHEIASRLRGALRAQDTVARVGGDEFAVVLPDAERAGAIATAKKVRAALERPLVVEGQRCRVGATVGIALFPSDAAAAPELVRRADIALYDAKSAGEPFRLYDPGTDRYTRERLALADELRAGMERGELLCHFQPQVRLRTGALVGVESLVRWRHPRRGLLLPAEFVPLAERSGLGADLTARVVANAIAWARAWERDGRPIVVAVNMTARDVLDPEMPDQVGAAIAAADLSPRLLRLELTEEQLLTDPDRAVRNLEAVGRQGVRCSLDDFGAGYASLGYLRRLPIDQLKVDGSIVAAIARDRVSAAIAKAALTLGADLGLEVVAEGVEDEAMRERLVAMGFELGQGYGLARPMPADELAAWLLTRPAA